MKNLWLSSLLLMGFVSHAQIISIVGTGVNGWPGNMTGAELAMTTTDFVTYTLPNVSVTTGEVKFRQDYDWAINWGGSTFPSGNGVQGGPNIPTVAGTYDITFNRTNGTYTFIGTTAFPFVGIWGPAVDGINGFMGPDVNMATVDGVNYRLSAFYFTSGTAVFRQDDNPNLVWSSTAFPTGTAVLQGPALFIPGGQYTVDFNRTTGAYDFRFPSVGVLGTAVDGWNTDVDLMTSNGEYYYGNIMLSDGALKFRLDDSWTTNWGGNGMSGTAVPNGADIVITTATPALHGIEFNRNTLAYTISTTLAQPQTTLTAIGVVPNPAALAWRIKCSHPIEQVGLFDLTGKLVLTQKGDGFEMDLPAQTLAPGMYLAKVQSGQTLATMKLIRE